MPTTTPASWRVPSPRESAPSPLVVEDALVIGLVVLVVAPAAPSRGRLDATPTTQMGKLLPSSFLPSNVALIAGSIGTLRDSAPLGGALVTTVARWAISSWFARTAWTTLARPESLVESLSVYSRVPS